MKSQKTLSCYSLSLLAALGSSLSAGAAINAFAVDFNGAATTYSDNFKTANDSAPAGFTWGAAVGTGGSGGLSVTNTVANNLFYRPGATPSDATSTFDINGMDAGSGFTSSVDFIWSNTTSTGTTLLNFGLTTMNTSASALSLGGGTDSSLSGSVLRNGSQNVTLRMRQDGGNVDTLNFSQSTLAAGSWYRLTYDLTKSATADQFAYAVSLFSIGADGSSTPTLFNDGSNDITLSGTVTSNGIYTDSNSKFAYDVRNTSGISVVDNFNVTAVPEPSTVGLSVLALAGFLLRRKRN